MTEVEPLPEDSPLYELDNVLLSPHCADRTAQFQVCFSHSCVGLHSHYTLDDAVQVILSRDSASRTMVLCPRIASVMALENPGESGLLQAENN